MKSMLLFSILTLSSIFSSAQTPIDGLQKQNLLYLESQENEGYEFRSQIITEFDASNASQNVNIKLSADYTYEIVALGDSNIPDVALEVKPSSKAKIESVPLNQSLTGQCLRIVPLKSSQFKISINTNGLSATSNGFVSFMVLRKSN